PFLLQDHHVTGVSVNIHDQNYHSTPFTRNPDNLRRDLVAGNETIGKLEIETSDKGVYLIKKTNFLNTLNKRISSAFRTIETEKALGAYYKQLEEVIEKRTKELETAQEKLLRTERLAAIGELASSVGHELRNPLNVMRNCVYLLNMLQPNTSQKESTSTLKLLDQQIDNANNIVSDLLDFTKVRTAHPCEFEVTSLVAEKINQVSIPENVTVACPPQETPLHAYADPEQIGRVVINLVTNAIQSIRDRGSVQISSVMDDGNVWLKFADTGCGIPPENLNKIFEPLFTTKPKGIGLGLAITRRFIEQNKGGIEVQSTVGQGTTFSIRLPGIKK
ncbi:MAG: ATP-binding protein, partial [Dehalococcoidales bacterium]|nr:ATP-binding protein [Dehalococcoidales bacterium]